MALTVVEIYEWIRPWLLDGHDRDRVLERLSRALACQTCGRPLRGQCSSCLGRMGGKKTSTEKTKAVRKNARRRRPRPGSRRPVVDEGGEA